MKAVTVLDVARARGVQSDADGTITAADVESAGLPFFGGCQRCGASIACYNAYPSRTGYLQCASCVGDDGFATPEEFEEFCEQEN